MKLSRTSALAGPFASIVYAALYALGAWISSENNNEPPSTQFLEGLFLLVLMPLGIHIYQRITSTYLMDASEGTPPDMAYQRYQRYRPGTYCVFLLSIGFLFGLKPSIALTLALLVVLILVQIGLYFFLIDADKRALIISSEKYIAVLFLVSGFSALIYQVVWQRTLFSTFGINSESVTVIVSVFMFGLGIGSLVGGYLQKAYPRHLLHLFLFLEIAIGVFGFFSLDLIHFIASISGTTSATTLVFWVYLILAIPTLLMGATLPILVAWLQGYLQNIGKTVGLLYAFNTIGSAIAAFFTVKMLFVLFGQHTSVLIAVACNFATACLIFDASRKLRRVTVAQQPAVPDIKLQLRAPSTPHTAHLPYSFIFITLLAIGYISLSQEILWFRLLGYMTANRPEVFGLLLTAFLIGIAAGSLKSKKICESTQEPYGYLLRALFSAIAVFYLAVPLIALTAAYLGKEAGALVAYLLIAIVAFFTGGILPMLIHVGINNKHGDSTQAMTWLYFANILGAAFGPLLTGFILLDRFSLEANIAILTGLTLLVLFALIIVIPKEKTYKRGAFGLMIAMVLGGWMAQAFLYQGHLEKIQYATSAVTPFKYTVENLSGILTVEGGKTDTMYGNGIYDGRFNIDPTINSNLIDRAYMLAGLHRKPNKILEIGFSTGSWARIITDYKPLQELTIVEINKGYRDLIYNYPEIATVLVNPKVNLFFDDGRRWLRNHPDQKFDFIIMNSTYYWRSNMTNLLSTEFLELCKTRLNKGGVVYYNATGSWDVVYTAAHAFKHVVRYSTFVAASDAPFDMTVEEKRNNFLQFRGGGVDVLFDKDEKHRALLDKLAATKLRDLHDEMLVTKNLWVITDDNMAAEYKVP